MCGQSDAMRTVRKAACQLSEACGVKGLLSDRAPALAQIPNAEIEKLLKRLNEIE
jgi:hypothetical protein